MPQIRVSLAFARAAEHQLEETAGEVLDGFTANPGTFLYPPVTLVDLDQSITNFTNAIAAQAAGGAAATALKTVAQDTLIFQLRKMANYVQALVDALVGTSAEKLALLLSSGFEAVATNRTRSPLETPANPQVRNGNSGELILKVPPVRNAKTYEVRYSVAGGAWQIGGLFTGAREMTVSGLTPGQVYTLQVRAIGGSTGYSGWSDPVQRMSM